MIASTDAAPDLLIDLDAAKLYLKVDWSEEDNLIKGLIAAAQQYCERFTNRALVPQTVSYTVQADSEGQLTFPIELPRPPFRELTGVTLVDLSGDDEVQDVSDFVVRGSDEGSLTSKDRRNRAGLDMTIVYRAGYEPGTVPAPIVEAMRLLVGHWYENREASTPANRDLREPTYGVKPLLEAYRVVRL